MKGHDAYWWGGLRSNKAEGWARGRGSSEFSFVRQGALRFRSIKHNLAMSRDFSDLLNIVPGYARS